VTVCTAVLVRPKVAGVVAPETLAVTVYAPAVPFAVQVTELTLPLESVVAVVAESAQVAPPEDVVAANVTVAPLSGKPFEVTVTPSGLAKAVFTVALCVASVPTAVITIVGGGVLELLLQPVRKPKARQISATRTLA
jgi:hypothetical protein